MKLLIADDSQDARELVGRLCASLATDIRYCEDGDEAIRCYETFQPDWTILDLSMPRMDGLAATRIILQQYPNARIVVLTQYRGAEYEQAARHAGARAFVSKDNLQELLTLLRQDKP
jgi:CheY-like chemotaxis protein